MKLAPDLSRYRRRATLWLRLRRLRWGKGDTIPVYAPPDPEGFADLFKHPGILDIRSLAALETLELGDFNLTPDALPAFISSAMDGQVVDFAVPQ
jgi:hypothetical protein